MTVASEESVPSGLERRLAKEPNYRPHCLHCQTMERMRLSGNRMICDDTKADEVNLRLLKNLGYSAGQMLANARWGCGAEWDIRTGEIYVQPSGKWVYPADATLPSA